MCTQSSAFPTISSRAGLEVARNIRINFRTRRAFAVNDLHGQARGVARAFAPVGFGAARSKEHRPARPDAGLQASGCCPWRRGWRPEYLQPPARLNSPAGGVLRAASTAASTAGSTAFVLSLSAAAAVPAKAGEPAESAQRAAMTANARIPAGMQERKPGRMERIISGPPSCPLRRSLRHSYKDSHLRPPSPEPFGQARRLLRQDGQGGRAARHPHLCPDRAHGRQGA